MKTSRVTIGITSFNLQQYIAQALDSVLAQKTDFDFDILIVDDCSTDKTQDIIKDYANRYPDKIRYLFNEKNHGSLYSSNTLFNNIKSEYISFLDGDDYWLDENHLQRQFDFLEEHDDYAIAAGNTLLEKNGLLTKELIVPEENTLHTYTIEDYMNMKCPFVHTSAVLLRNVVYNNGVPKEYIEAEEKIENLVYRGEDIRRIHHLQKGKMFIFPDVFSVYRIHDKGMWSGMSEFKKTLETNIRNLCYIDIFPEYKDALAKRFLNSYPYCMNMIASTLLKDPKITRDEFKLMSFFLDKANLFFNLKGPQPIKYYVEKNKIASNFKTTCKLGIYGLALLLSEIPIVNLLIKEDKILNKIAKYSKIRKESL